RRTSASRSGRTDPSPPAPAQNGGLEVFFPRESAALPLCFRQPPSTASSPSVARVPSRLSLWSVFSGARRLAAAIVTAATPLDAAEAMKTPPRSLLFAQSGMLVAPRSTPL